MEKEWEQYLKEGFTKAQIAELEEGKECGLDISVYADKNLMAVQMRQIRLGLMEGIGVEKYTDARFDWFQMEEIRLGLLEGLDVDKYAKTSIPYDKMRQVRKGLKEGVDLSKYLKLDAALLREVRKALAEKINILEFIKDGYDAKQLLPIRLALRNKINIRPYLLKDYRGVAIEEIRLGLEKGLDVSVYADVRLSWLQMREIRLGLEHRVDVSRYNNPLYSWEQMREIRLGLEHRVDVSRYVSFMYTAKEMEKRRLELEATLIEEDVVDFMGTGLERWIDYPTFSIRLAEDEMSAFIVVKKGEKLRRDDLDMALKTNRIERGLDYNAIAKLVKGNFTEPEVKIAEGKMAADGKDGWYEYFFRTDMKKTPHLLEDGSVDYRKIEWFEVVKEGQKIAFYHEPEKGTDGWTVTGKRIKAKSGREQNVLGGTGIRMLQDGKTYIATMHGRIELLDGKIEISKMLVVEDVTISNGNIKFDGSVYVTGDIKKGAKIEATEDIVVDGFVEGAVIECGGNILFRKGVNADNQGYIRAGGDISGRFFEDTTLYAGRNISANYFLGSLLKAEGKIIVSGRNGTIAGGRVFCMRGIEANNLGNKAGISTFIKLGIDDTVANQHHNIEEKIHTITEDIEVMKKAEREICKKFSPEQRNTMEVFMKLQKSIYLEKEKLKELNREKEKLDEEIKEIRSVRVVARGWVYEGVVLEMNGCKWVAKNNCNVNIRSRDGRIVVGSN